MYDTCGILDAHHLLGRGLRTSEVLKLQKSSLVKLQIGLVEILVWNGFLGILALRKLANSSGMAPNMVLQRVAFSAVVKPWFGSSVWKATDGNGDMEHSRHSRQMEEMSLVCFFLGMRSTWPSCMQVVGYMHMHPYSNFMRAAGAFLECFEDFGIK